MGFEEIKAETPGVLDWDIIEGNVKRRQFSPDRFWAYVAENTSDQCKHDLQAWITKHNLSSHMRLIATKPLDS